MGPPVRNSRDALARSYLNCECVIRPRQRTHRCFIYNRPRKALPQFKLKVKQIPRAAPSSYLLQQGIFPAGRGKSVFPFPLHQQEQLQIPQRGSEQQEGAGTVSVSLPPWFVAWFLGFCISLQTSPSSLIPAAHLSLSGPEIPAEMMLQVM